MDIFLLNKWSRLRFRLRDSLKTAAPSTRRKFRLRSRLSRKSFAHHASLGLLCALRANIGISAFKFPNFSRRLELKIGPDVEVAKPTIKVVEEVKRNAGCSEKNAVLSSK